MVIFVKKKLVLLVLLSLLLSLTAFAASGDTTVYITKSGAKYHQYGCGYLSKSCIPISLANAVASGYEPCSRCYPPTLDRAQPVQSTPAPTPVSTPAPVSTPVPVTEVPSITAAPTPTPTPFKVSDSARAAQIESNRQMGIQAGKQAASDVSAHISDDGTDNSTRLLAYILPTCVLLCSIPSALFYRAKKKADEEVRRLESELSNEFGKHHKEMKETVMNAEADAKQREWNAKKEAYLECYGNRPSIQFVNKPNGEWIGPDGLPCSSGDGKWGDRFTFYLTANGKSFHKKRGCSSASIEINAYNVKYRDLSPCKRCNPRIPSLDWFEEYLEIEDTRRKYGISYVHYQIEPDSLENRL